MAISYLKKAKSIATRSFNTIGSYLMRPVDKLIEKDKEHQAWQAEQDRKNKIANFGSVAAYDKLQEEAAAREKERLIEKQKGTPQKKSYLMKGR